MRNKTYLCLSSNLVLYLAQCCGFHSWSTTSERYLWSGPRRGQLWTLSILISSWKNKQRWATHMSHDTELYSLRLRGLKLTMTESRFFTIPAPQELSINLPAVFRAIKKWLQSGSVGSLAFFSILLLSRMFSSSPFKSNLFIWLHQVLAAAWGMFHCGTQTLQ